MKGDRPMTKHSKSLPKAKPATTSATAAKKAKLVNSADGSRAKGVARCWRRLLNGHVSGGLTNTGLLMEGLVSGTELVHAFEASGCIGVERTRDEKPLAEVTTKHDKLSELLCCLDAFRCSDDAEIMRQRDDRCDELRSVL
jgi:hypothetical protein